MDAEVGGGMRWAVEDPGPFVVVRTSGTFDTGDHRSMVRDVISRDFWRPGRDILFDHRALSFDGVGYASMATAARTHESYDLEIGDGRAAILMRTRADFGVGRIFDAVAGDRIAARLHIFTDEAEARRWLCGDGSG